MNLSGNIVHQGSQEVLPAGNEDTISGIERRFRVHEILDASPETMNGLASRKELENGSDFLRTEYARATGILKLKRDGKSIEIPGRSDEQGETIFLPKAAIEASKGMTQWVKENPELIFAAGEYLWILRLPQDIRRDTCIDSITRDFSRTATSPLKHDIISVFFDNELGPEMVSIMNGSHQTVSERRKRRRYTLGNHPNWEAEVNLRNHKAHYEKLLAMEGRNPPTIHLTLSGKSANTALIRKVTKEIPPEKMSVLPGFFFLNEADFEAGTENTIEESTRAIFASIEPGYADLPLDDYRRMLHEWMRKFTVLAQKYPDESFSIVLDATSDLLSFQEGELGQVLKEAIKSGNIRLTVCSSLTKYNHHEPNYHYGIIADFSHANEDELEALIQTSYGGLSPLGILQFPRLKKHELLQIRNAVTKSGKDFIDGITESISHDLQADMIVESHTPYCYIRFPGLEENERNKLVEAFLKDEDIRGYVGSSFYLDHFRICDVPDVDCSRFSQNETRPFRNNLRISFPSGLHDSKKFGKLVGKKLNELLHEKHAEKSGRGNER